MCRRLDPHAVGARIEAPKAPRIVGCGKETREGSAEGAVPPLSTIFRFF